MINLTFVSQALNTSISNVMTFQPTAPTDWLTLSVLITLTLLMGAAVIWGVGHLLGPNLDHVDRANMGYLSTLMVTTLYFQYFGNYVLFLLSSSDLSFIFFMLGTLALMLSATLTYQTTFFMFFARYANHPNLMRPGCNNPRGIFIGLFMLYMSANYVVSTAMLRFLSYSYYLLITSTFPIVNIIENAFHSVKKCYSP